MSDPTNVFDNNNNDNNNNVSNAPSAPDYSELLLSIKNENGEQKYKTVEEALKGLANAQEYIPKLHKQIDALKNEKSSLEENYNKSLSSDEKFERLLEELRNSKETHMDSGLDEPPPPPPPPQEDDKVDKDSLYQDFRNRMYEEEQARIRENNVNAVSDYLYRVYGDKAYSYLAQKASEVGMTVDDVKNLAANSPKAAINLLGIKPSNEFNVSSSKNTAGFKTYEDSEIKRNKGTLLGSDTYQLKEEFRKSGVMASQLRERGLSIDDLTNPSNYFKFFNN